MNPTEKLPGNPEGELSPVEALQKRRDFFKDKLYHTHTDEGAQYYLRYINEANDAIDEAIEGEAGKPPPD